MIEIWLNLHDLFEMVDGEISLGLIFNHSSDVSEGKDLLSGIQNVHGTIDV